MSQDKHDPHEYIEQVRNGTRQYLQDLLREADGLRAALVRAEAETRSLRTEVERARLERKELEQRLAEAAGESRRFSQQYLVVEQQNSSLAHLYVASYRLHATLDRDEVLLSIREIVANLIGSEELGVFELEPGGRAFRLVDATGLDRDRWARVPLDGDSVLARIAASGETFVVAEAGRLTDGEPLTACIPLRVDGTTTGLIAIFGLLAQKRAIEPLDRELCDLLATHAATALYCTSLHAQARSARARGEHVP